MPSFLGVSERQIWSHSIFNRKLLGNYPLKVAV